MADMVPRDGDRKKTLRACLLCGLLKTSLAFVRDGCENCESLLQMAGSSERAAECTSAAFEGFIAVMAPEKSWVARWQRVDKFTKGLYAIRVLGRLPEEVEEELRAAGVTYRPRDGSAMD